MTEGSIAQTRAGRVAAPLPAEVQASLRHCHRVARRRARNFYYGLKLTPEPRRSALYAVYAYMRACDDLVDGAEPPSDDAGVEAALRRIDAFRRDTRQAVATDQPLPAGDLWPALRHVVHAFGVAPHRLYTMLDGQRMDVTTTRYATFDDTYDYCYRVASVVGLACLDVWGHDGAPGVPQLAEYRGIAFQLTNILRDVVEDAERGRVYLPQEDLGRFDVSLEDLRLRNHTVNFERLMVFQIERVRSYYEMSASLERHVTPECRATSWAMTEIYRRLLERIAAAPAAVLRKRVRLGSAQKLAIALRATWRKRADADGR